MKVKRILLFDSNGETKLGRQIHISNTPQEIEILLENAPVVNKQDHAVGIVLSANNKYGSTLYYGDIDIFDPKYKSFRIIGQDISYNDPPQNNVYAATGITTVIEPIDSHED